MKYTCPCCGYLVFDEEPGSYDVCPICRWEDDAMQLKFPNLGTGSNHVSLMEAQKNYSEHGVSELSLIKHVRKPTIDDKRDPEWRLLDNTKDIIADNDEFRGIAAHPDWEDDVLSLYYWRNNS